MTTPSPHLSQSAPQLPFAYARMHGVLLEPDTSPPCVLHRADLAFETIVELRRAVAQPLTFRLLADEQFAACLTRIYQQGSSEALQMAEEVDLGRSLDLDRLAEDIPATGDLMEGEDEAPVIRLINAILSRAVREKASDIHLETFEDRFLVRFRLDGVLREILAPSRRLAPLLISRIKVMARLDIAEKRIPQDGRMSVRLAGHAVDIRVSTIPSAFGERAVLRLLDKQTGQLALSELRMNAGVLDGLRQTLARAHGILLVTGPTGSGKTTTLYSGLAHINDASRNILTIEDPIEYLLPGIGQTQVNPRVEMTFARGLRAILRQDPDVVMVGEIRDGETARIAVQASLTGHLVLSTLHTNTALGAVARLRDMGVESFLLASSLLAVMAQRLVRALCLKCRLPRPASLAECRLLGVDAAAPPLVHEAHGCPDCSQTGYRGRLGIYELVTIDDGLRAMIHRGAPEQELVRYAREASGDIFEDGCRRVLAGETTLQEVLRVTAA